MAVEVRKIQTGVEEILHEGGPPAAVPLRVGAVAVVIANPFAGRYVEELQPYMEELKPLGLEMAQRLIDATGGGPEGVSGFGKASIVGGAGELEHGALWHVPITHINACYVRGHFNAIEVGVPGAPQADELVFILAMASGGRVHDRMGGLRAADIEGEDGLR